MTTYTCTCSTPIECVIHNRRKADGRVTKTTKRHNVRVGGKYAPKLIEKINNTIFTTIGIGLVMFSAVNLLNKRQTELQFISPESTTKFEINAAEITLTPTPTTNPVEQEIKTVFGKYADNALKIANCESRLKHDALNDNTKWGGVGQDRGVFQINNVYQKINNQRFLDDPAINIRIAWRIFEDSGYSFRAWTCSRTLGIK